MPAQRLSVDCERQLEAVKSGRNTLVVFDSVKRYVDRLPPARFKQYPSQAKRIDA